MAVTVTVAQVIDAIRAGNSDAEVKEVERLLGFATAVVTEHAPGAPDVIANEAAIRMVGWMFDAPNAAGQSTFANALVSSGAGSILLPYRTHRAGPIQTALQSTGSGDGAVVVTDVSVSSTKLVVRRSDGTAVVFTLPSGGGGIAPTAFTPVAVQYGICKADGTGRIASPDAPYEARIPNFDMVFPFGTDDAPHGYIEFDLGLTVDITRVLLGPGGLGGILQTSRWTRLTGEDENVWVSTFALATVGVNTTAHFETDIAFAAAESSTDTVARNAAAAALAEANKSLARDMAAGGVQGNRLVKKSDTDYDTEWAADTGVLPTGGTINQVLAKIDSTDGNAQWVDVNDGTARTEASKAIKAAATAQTQVDRNVNSINQLGRETGANAVSINKQGVPSGGTTGQVLAKKSGTDYDDQWVTPASGGGGGITFTDIVAGQSRDSTRQQSFILSQADTDKLFTAFAASATKAVIFEVRDTSNVLPYLRVAFWNPHALPTSSKNFYFQFNEDSETDRKVMQWFIGVKGSSKAQFHQWRLNTSNAASIGTWGSKDQLRIFTVT